MTRREAHYTDFLRSRYEERIGANPRYSLRAFARDLAVSPSRLSEILSGKQGLSAASAQKLAKRLRFSVGETQRFCDLVLASDGRSKRARASARDRLETRAPTDEVRQLQEDTFRTISDWYHYAILELTRVEGFRSDVGWIAERLGITALQAQAAIDRLLRLGLLTLEDGELSTTGVQLTTTDGVPSESIRKFSRQLLEKAIQAVVFQTVEERDLGTLTSAVNTEDLPAVREMVRRFRRELNAFLNERNQARAPNAVYCLGTQFFRLTEKMGDKT